MANQGLSPNDIYSVSVTLSPQLAVGQTQTVPLIVGTSSAINVSERVRSFTGGSSALTTIAAEFTNASGEYLAAQAIYERAPTLPLLQIGRWAETATPAILLGGSLTVAQQALSNFTGITNGSLDITYGASPGTAYTITAITFAGATSLTQVAAAVTTALSDSAVCAWDSVNSRFTITTSETGATALITFATTAGSGTDVSALLQFQSGNGGSIVLGIAAETPLQAIQACRAADSRWYFAHFSLVVGGVWQGYDSNLTTAAHLAVANYIESVTPPSTYGIGSNDTAMLNPASTTDIASVISAAGLKRTWAWYSSSCGTPGLAEFGKFALVDYTASGSATIAMFDALPGVVAETLTEAQKTGLAGKQGNVYVQYSNQTAIVQYGTMGSGNYFDEIHATDALAATLQNDIINALITASGSAKIPQTQQGLITLQSVASTDCEQFVNAGVIGRGLVWSGPPVGAIKTGDTLPAGYYIYQPPITSQSPSARQSRQAPLMQICINLAGAVQGGSISIEVTR